MLTLKQSLNMTTAENAALKEEIKDLRKEMKDLQASVQNLDDDNINLRAQLSATRKKQEGELNHMKTHIRNVYEALKPLLT